MNVWGVERVQAWVWLVHACLILQRVLQKLWHGNGPYKLRALLDFRCAGVN